MQRTDSFEKTLMLGKIEGSDDRGRDDWMASPTQWTWVWVSSGSWWWTGKPGLLQYMGSQRVRQDWATEQRNVGSKTIIPYMEKEICVPMCWKTERRVSVAQSCPTVCDPMDCSPPGSSVHGILQARILEWVVIPFSRRSSWPRNWTIAGRFFTVLSHQESPICEGISIKIFIKNEITERQGKYIKRINKNKFKGPSNNWKDNQPFHNKRNPNLKH